MNKVELNFEVINSVKTQKKAPGFCRFETKNHQPLTAF